MDRHVAMLLLRTKEFMHFFRMKTGAVKANFYIAWILASMVICFVSCSKQKTKWEGTIEEVDGVTVMKNPGLPSRGTILLELEKIREINPYDYPEIGLRSFYSVRDEDGEVILFDSNRAEAYRFDSKGEYIGGLIRKGQGPGEFQQFQHLRIFFLDDQIWATSMIKLAKFDKKGDFLEEQKFDESPDLFVDKTRYITIKRPWIEGKQLWKVTLVNFGTKKDTVFFEAVRDWYIRKGNTYFSDSWATPSICYAYCPFSSKVYAALNEEYKVCAYDLEGKLIQTIEKPHQKVRISKKDKDFLMDWALRNESYRWMVDAYPDALAVIRDMAVLPRGYLVVYRIIGPKEFDIDVFDPEGKYTYILKLPEGISLERARFYDFGFTTIMEQDELPIYFEFRIKNLPEIFTN
jgi:hypothetical protein